ncbi:hypothetical protein GCM10010303_09580 [Streptomyces purpurascens]|nr:hypothetical protein GCM10010303_09580 [Streptomyces purpurascens]
MGVGQKPVHRDPGALVHVLGRARWEQVEHAAEVLAGAEPGLGQQPVAIADAAVEDDEGVPVVGGPDEHIGDVQKRQERTSVGAFPTPWRSAQTPVRRSLRGPTAARAGRGALQVAPRRAVCKHFSPARYW